MSEEEDGVSGALRRAKEEYRAGRNAIGELFAPLYSEGNLGARERAARHQFDVATVDLVVTGLEAWLAAGAKDRASAEKDRESAAKDRIAQDKDRDTMNRLTIVIALFTAIAGIATAVSAFKASAPIVVPAPVLAAPPAPVVNIAPVPVTLSPTINVTLPQRRSRSTK
jgi:hypothetical protein